MRPSGGDSMIYSGYHSKIAATHPNCSPSEISNAQLPRKKKNQDSQDRGPSCCRVPCERLRRTRDACVEGPSINQKCSWTGSHQIHRERYKSPSQSRALPVEKLQLMSTGRGNTGVGTYFVYVFDSEAKQGVRSKCRPPRVDTLKSVCRSTWRRHTKTKHGL